MPVLEDGTGILFDPPEEDPSFDQDLKEEEAIRPKEANVFQLQMDSFDYFQVFWVDAQGGKHWQEFADYAVLERWVKRQVRDEWLAEQGLTMMSNFRLAEINLRDRTAFPVRGYNKVGQL